MRLNSWVAFCSLPFLLSAGFRLTSAPGLPPSPAAAAAAAGQDGPQVLLLRQGDEFQVRVQKPFVRVDLTEAWFVAQLAQHLEMLRGAAGRLAIFSISRTFSIDLLT